MRYLSVCSGIEAATAAWHPLGWEPAGFSEIEPFPSAVLAHHYPDVPNFGDFTTIDHEALGPIDLLVGGTPCQSFSIAGLRKGMDDDRGNLALEFVRLALSARPRWVVWENVPGVLSSNEGRDFGSLLGALGECGYGFAHRVLDAQYFGLAQRRKRVFVVGYLGDWRPAAAVLLERQGLQGHPPPSREKRKDAADGPENGPVAWSEELTASRQIAGTIQRGGSGGRHDGVMIPQVAPTIPSRGTGGGGLGTDFDCDGGLIPEVARPLTAESSDRQDPAMKTYIPEVSHTLRGEGHDASEDGTGRGVPMVVNARQDPAVDRDSSPPLGAKDWGHALCFQQNTRDEVRLLGGDGEVAGALAAESGAKQTNYVLPQHAVRRLTPRECERLQGFPDDFTRIPWKGKEVERCPDGPRYKALGNSMAVPVMRWIGERIEQVESILAEEGAHAG